VPPPPRSPTAWRLTLLRTSQRLLLALLIFCPLAFGTVEVWSMTVAQAIIFLAATLYLLAVLPGGATLPAYRTPGLVPLVLLALFMLAQLIPLPPTLLAAISPATAGIYTESVWIIAPDSWLPLSLHPANTVNELLRFAACVALYYLSVQLLSRREFLRRTLLVLAVLAAGIALLAILQRFSSPQKIYWFREVPGNNPIGPWVYRNHFAGYMEMALPVVFALFLLARPRTSYRLSWRQRLQSFFSLPDFNPYLWYGLAAFLITIAIFLSQSRGGVVSMGLALLVFALLAARRTRMTRVWVWSSVVLVLLLAGWYGGENVAERFTHLVDVRGEVQFDRWDVWRDCLGIIRDFPFWGTGFGAFIEIYRSYRTVPGTAIFDHAHNDYVELLTDGGLVAGLLALMFFLLIFRSVFSVLRQRHDRYSVLLGLGAFSGVLALLIHSISDFNLHNGANTFAFFFTCGLMVAVASLRDKGRTRETLLEVKRRDVRLPVFALLTGGLLIGSLICHLGHIRGMRILYDLDKVYLNRHIKPERIALLLAKAERAAAFAPLVAHAHFMRGNLLAFQGEMDQAQAALARAIRRRPLECVALQRAGYYLTLTQPQEANRLYQAASRCNRDKPQCHLNHAAWLFMQQRRPEALAALRRLMALTDPAPYVPVIMTYRLTMEELLAAMPELARPSLRFAEYFWKEERKEQALTLYRGGMKFLHNEELVEPWFFLLGYRWLSEEGLDEEAMALLRRAVDYLPKEADFHVLLGDGYYRQGIRYRAEEEYRKAQFIRPGNDAIRQRLEMLRQQKPWPEGGSMPSIR